MNDIDALESDLKQLPEPVFPEGMAAVVSARIAHVAALRATAAPSAAAEGSAGDTEVSAGHFAASPGIAAASAAPNRFAWAAALVGLTLAVGAETYRLLTGETGLDLVSPRTIGIGVHGPFEMLSASPAAAVLAAGLALYVASFFAPPAGRQRNT